MTTDPTMYKARREFTLGDAFLVFLTILLVVVIFLPAYLHARDVRRSKYPAECPTCLVCQAHKDGKDTSQ